MVTITVDGVDVQVDESKNLIDALKEVGIEIPHFCYHEELSVVGMCRMCLIEIEGVPKLQVGCNTAVKEGMKINLSNEKVRSAREGVMEFLLINHPLDCPVCDKAGECRLQNYSFSVGDATTRYREQKRVVPQEKIGTNLLINHDRCIVCYRCVRFDREVVGIDDLEMKNRGNDTVIAYTPLPGSEQQYLDHNYQGALADLCPVGALLNENMLFKSRVWWYDDTQSICHGCSTLCNVTANIKNNEIYRYMPPEHPEKNGHFICDKGRFSTAAFSKQRLFTYLKNAEPAKSSEVFEAAKDRLNSAKSVVLIGGATLSNEEIDGIEKQIEMLKQAGKSVIWEFKTEEYMWQNKFTEMADFLMSTDERPNSNYLLKKSSIGAGTRNDFESAVKKADLVITLGEFSAPYDFIPEDALVNFESSTAESLKQRAVEKTALFQLLESSAAWDKTIVLTTHESRATEKSMAAMPILAFAEKSASYLDRKGETKQSSVSIKPVQGLYTADVTLNRFLEKALETAQEKQEETATA